MDKNTITGFILMALVVIGFSWYSQPSEEERRLMAQQDSIAAVEKQKAEKAVKEQKKVAEAVTEQVSSPRSLTSLRKGLPEKPYFVMLEI